MNTKLKQVQARLTETAAPNLNGLKSSILHLYKNAKFDTSDTGYIRVKLDRDTSSKSEADSFVKMAKANGVTWDGWDEDGFPCFLY